MGISEKKESEVKEEKPKSTEEKKEAPKEGNAKLEEFSKQDKEEETTSEPEVKKEPERTSKKEPTEREEMVLESNEDFFSQTIGAFQKKIKSYFNEKQITIDTYDIVKKNKEFNFVLTVPSTIGTSKFYCKSLDKKKISEGDLALVLVEGQYKNLPVIFITSGEIAKKVHEKMSTIFKDVNHIKL